MKWIALCFMRWWSHITCPTNCRDWINCRQSAMCKATTMKTIIIAITLRGPCEINWILFSSIDWSISFRFWFHFDIFGIFERWVMKLFVETLNRRNNRNNMTITQSLRISKVQEMTRRCLHFNVSTYSFRLFSGNSSWRCCWRLGNAFVRSLCRTSLMKTFLSLEYANSFCHTKN